MSEFKEFLGKTLDAAIAEACAYYDAPREKLEIDIVEDAKSGIFGLVGARKARIRARRALLPDMNGRPKNKPRAAEADDAATAEGKSRQNKRGAKDRRAAETAESAGLAPAAAEDADDARPAPVETAAPEPAEASVLPAAAEAPALAADDTGDAPAEAPRESRRGRAPRNAPRPPRAERAADDAPAEPGHDGDMQELAVPRVALSELDQDQLRAVAVKMVSGLVFPIVGEVPLEVALADDRVQVRVECEDTGLLIGREGQNLAAVQYLAARMVTRAMGAQVRVQVDAGDYHSRQDSRLQELARSLADKVRATGKSQSTRPLSAYQRRVIHLTLQDDPDVQTRSSGEGPLKRVVVLRRKD